MSNLDALLTRKSKLASDSCAAPAPTSDHEEGLFRDILVPAINAPWPHD